MEVEPISSIAASLLGDFKEEIAATRRVLAQIPTDQLTWRPHPKSASLGELASHIAELPSWTAPALQHHASRYAGQESTGREPLELESTAAILDLFERNAGGAQEIVSQATDPALIEPWDPGGKVDSLFAGTRAAVFRRMVLRHLVHHRGQLTIYLRLIGALVPGTYGPSADEASL